MAADEPPYLTVGTDVSAKYKGAFCEAKVKKVNRLVKCKVSFKNNLGTSLITDDQIQGTLRVGAHVEAKHPEKNQFHEAIITKLLDYSQYTVVFDDGDETTLRRTSLCLKSGRHFAESESLDQLPLTNPEHFGTPVIVSKTRRKRRSAICSAAVDYESSDEETSPPKRDRREADLGKVVCIDVGDKRKRDNWFPALVVSSAAQDDIPIGNQDHLVRSFKDGKYYQVSKKDSRNFTREMCARIENTALRTAADKAITFLDSNELPAHWDWDAMMGRQSAGEESQGSDSETSDDEPSEEKDRFVAQLYKFMEEKGTPINKAPSVGNRDLNLCKLFKTVHKMGGFNRVTNQNQWKMVCSRIGIPTNTSTNTSQQMKQAYKKYLHGFEDFYRKLGCTMASGGRSSRVRHRSDRNLIMTRNRDRDLQTISHSPRSSSAKKEKKKEEKVEKEAEKEEVRSTRTRGRETAANKEEEKEEVKETASETPEKKETRLTRSESMTEFRSSERTSRKESVIKERKGRDSQSEGSSKDRRSQESRESKDVKTPDSKESARERRESKERDKKAESKEESPKSKRPLERKDRRQSAVGLKERKTQPKDHKTDKPSVELKQVKKEPVDVDEPPPEKEPESVIKKDVPPRSSSEKEKPKPERKLKREQSFQGKKVTEKKGKPEVVATPPTPVRVPEVVKEVKKAVVVVVVKSEEVEEVEDSRCSPEREEEDSDEDSKEDTKDSKGKDCMAKKMKRGSKDFGNLEKTEDGVEEHSNSEEDDSGDVKGGFEIGHKVRVRYGSTKQHKIYEAKIIKVDETSPKPFYVHYTGWNMRYDEWIKKSRIVENLSGGMASRKRKMLLAAKSGVVRPSSGNGSNRGRPTTAPSHSSSSSSPQLSHKSSSSTSPSSSRSRLTRSDKANLCQGLEPRRRVRRKSGVSNVDSEVTPNSDNESLHMSDNETSNEKTLDSLDSESKSTDAPPLEEKEIKTEFKPEDTQSSSHSSLISESDIKTEPEVTEFPKFISCKDDETLPKIDELVKTKVEEEKEVIAEINKEKEEEGNSKQASELPSEEQATTEDDDKPCMESIADEPAVKIDEDVFQPILLEEKPPKEEPVVPIEITGNEIGTVQFTSSSEDTESEDEVLSKLCNKKDDLSDEYEEDRPSEAIPFLQRLSASIMPDKSQSPFKPVTLNMAPIITTTTTASIVIPTSSAALVSPFNTRVRARPYSPEPVSSTTTTTIITPTLSLVPPFSTSIRTRPYSPEIPVVKKCDTPEQEEEVFVTSPVVESPELEPVVAKKVSEDEDEKKLESEMFEDKASSDTDIDDKEVKAVNEEKKIPDIPAPVLPEAEEKVESDRDVLEDVSPPVLLKKEGKKGKIGKKSEDLKGKLKKKVKGLMMDLDGKHKGKKKNKMKKKFGDGADDKETLQEKRKKERKKKGSKMEAGGDEGGKKMKKKLKKFKDKIFKKSDLIEKHLKKKKVQLDASKEATSMASSQPDAESPEKSTSLKKEAKKRKAKLTHEERPKKLAKKERKSKLTLSCLPPLQHSSSSEEPPPVSESDIAFLLCEEKVPASPVELEPPEPEEELNKLGSLAKIATSILPHSVSNSSSSTDSLQASRKQNIFPMEAIPEPVPEQVEQQPMLDNTPPTTPESEGSLLYSTPPHETLFRHDDFKPQKSLLEGMSSLSTESSLSSSSTSSSSSSSSSSSTCSSGSEHSKEAPASKTFPMKKVKVDAEESPVKRRRKVKRPSGTMEVSPPINFGMGMKPRMTPAKPIKPISGESPFFPNELRARCMLGTLCHATDLALLQQQQQTIHGGSGASGTMDLKSRKMSLMDSSDSEEEPSNIVSTSANTYHTCSSSNSSSPACSTTMACTAPPTATTVSTPLLSSATSSKFNFYVSLNEDMDANKRISIIQDKLCELRKTYLSLKAEVALIDRRRKKAKRKEKDLVLSSSPNTAAGPQVIESSPS